MPFPPYSGTSWKFEKWKVTGTHVGWEREDNSYIEQSWRRQKSLEASGSGS